MNTDPKAPASNERLMAAVAHAGIVLMPLGIALPAMVWGLQSKKSAYVREQSIQALAFQIAYNVVILIGSLLTLILCLIVVAVVSRHTPDQQTARTTITSIALIPLLFAGLVTIVFNITGIVACIQTILGRDFSYPWSGKHMRKYLSQSNGTEPSQTAMTRAERLMTVLNHLTIFLPLWGIISPLLIWMMEEQKDSPFRQEMKAITLFQIGQAVATLLFTAIGLFILPIGIIPLVSGGGSTGDSGPMILFAGIVLLFLLVMLFSLTVQIGFQTLGIIAAVKTWRGETYTYPLLGRFTKKNQSHNPGV
jgi:uncharacterized Tic20 family protein